MERKILCQSYVSYEGQEYFVSTINRTSSAYYGGPLIYAETLVWEYDRTINQRGDLVLERDDLRDSIRMHVKVVEDIFNHGITDACEEAVR
jgi:hypothetical protein